jgi:hypothetical protein
MVLMAIKHNEILTLPELIIGVLGIVVAVAALLVTETTLKDVNKQLDETFLKLDNTLVEIKNQEKRLEEDITNLEDATRRNLTGFAEIFDRSLWLLEQAEREIIYANFVLGFGFAHSKNEVVKKSYEALPNKRKPTFEEATNKFWNLLKEKVNSHRITKVKFVTLNQQTMMSDFLEQLSKRQGYEYLKDVAFKKQVCDREGRCRETLSNALNDKRDDWTLPDKTVEWRMGHRLPIQVLIAGLPPRPGKPQETRYGCIVFLLGTESLAGVKKSGTERGFYTELQHIIEMYRDFVDNAVESFVEVSPKAPVSSLSKDISKQLHP